jgi:hypothetical protein
VDDIDIGARVLVTWSGFERRRPVTFDHEPGVVTKPRDSYGR